MKDIFESRFVLQLAMNFSRKSFAALLLAALSLVPERALCDAGCANPVDAIANPAWLSIAPPKEDVGVVYASPSGWIGLNHIYASRQVLTHKRRALLPYLMPRINAVFQFTHALEAPRNEKPLFYVDHSVAAAYLTDAESREIHLLRLSPSGKDRVLETTSGASVFSFAPGFSARSLVPLKINILSNTVLTIQPERRLPDGEYLIVLGPVASNGFEFEIDCLQPRRSNMPRIDADPAH
jgi:hypothetical protein